VLSCTKKWFLCPWLPYSSKTSLGTDLILKIPKHDVATSATTCNYRFDAAPAQSVGRGGLMASQYHVGGAGVRFVLGVGTLLEIDVPDKDFLVV
jgi:hypothetical protein